MQDALGAPLGVLPSRMYFRLSVAKPQVKNGLSWLVVCGNATRPLSRVHEDRSQCKKNIH